VKYLLMLYTDEKGFAKLSRTEQEQGVAAYMAYGEALQKANALVDSARLASASVATTVRVANGKSQVLDGPYADTKEKIGGFFLIDVPDLDAALAWAARCPAASHGAVEVRPLFGQS
jgi:hypothetical protein